MAKKRDRIEATPEEVEEVPEAETPVEAPAEELPITIPSPVVSNPPPRE